MCCCVCSADQQQQRASVRRPAVCWCPCLCCGCMREYVSFALKGLPVATRPTCWPGCKWKPAGMSKARVACAVCRCLLQSRVVAKLCQPCVGLGFCPSVPADTMHACTKHPTTQSASPSLCWLSASVCAACEQCFVILCLITAGRRHSPPTNERPACLHAPIRNCFVRSPDVHARWCTRMPQALLHAAAAGTLASGVQHIGPTLTVECLDTQLCNTENKRTARGRGQQNATTLATQTRCSLHTAAQQLLMRQTARTPSPRRI